VGKGLYKSWQDLSVLVSWYQQPQNINSNTNNQHVSYKIRSMAGLHMFSRRVRHILSARSTQVVLACVFILSALRYVIVHNYRREPPILTITLDSLVEPPDFNWTNVYNVQYAATPIHLCNALMLWSQIERIGSRAQRLMYYPSHWSPDEIDDSDPEKELTPIARLLTSAIEDYAVTLQPLDVLHENNPSRETWAGCFTKFLAFNLTEYSRVLVIDSAATLYQHIDDLFFLPASPIAMPYVYWGEPEGWQFSSHLMLITPTPTEFSKINDAVRAAGPEEYDVDILNTIYNKNQILRIPQRPFNLLSGEFRRRSHGEYLASSGSSKKKELWDPEEISNDVKYMHFSDWPIPEPWIKTSKEVLNKYMPRCAKSEWFGATDCRAREMWLQLYVDFQRRRKAICGKGFELLGEEEASKIMGEGHGKERLFHPDER